MDVACIRRLCHHLPAHTGNTWAALQQILNSGSQSLCACRREGAGLLAATFVGLVPSYVSRSVAGSYDNEAVAIFALVNVFHMFIRTVNTGAPVSTSFKLIAVEICLK